MTIPPLHNIGSSSLCQFAIAEIAANFANFHSENEEYEEFCE